MANIRSKIVIPDHNTLREGTPQCLLTGDTPDMSRLVEFAFYDFVWYWDPGRHSLENRKLGKYLGSSRDIGEAMCANILGVEGYVMGRTSVWPLTDEEKRSEVVKEQMKEFKENLKENIRNSDTIEGT